MAQSGLLEDYTERRGGAAAAPATASSVAATLETMIQLQQRLLTLTAAQQQQAVGMGLPAVPGVGAVPPQQPAGVGGSGYRGADDFGASSRGLPDVDLQKSLQQLRQSQRYNVGGASSYTGGASVGLPHQQALGGYLGGSAGGLRDSGGPSCYQSSTVGTYSAKKAPFSTSPMVPGSYSSAGSSQVAGSFGSTGAYAASGALSSAGSLGGTAGGLARTNEYRKSSLGPTAPIPTSFGRTSTLSGQLRPTGIMKRF